VPDAVAVLPDPLRPAAETLFGSRLDLAHAYAELLCTDGVVRGLIGPREAPRIWERHLLNCAAMERLLASGQYVVDVGSGAGLPGIVLAVARPDITVTLIEPLARRTAFLDEAVDRLGLTDQVTVVRGRAEEVAARPSMFHVKPAEVVTARAVAPLDRLAGWCLPLARVGGRLLAMKGSSAAEEIAEHTDAVMRLGGGTPVIHECAADVLEAPTIVVEVARVRERESRSATRQRSGTRSGRG
jgi:16S rRNA (guanine527-N7)-methyltransferase